MEVILAKSAGFCFGVKRAVDTVYEQIGTRGKIYTYRPIIHNEEVVGDLEQKGVKVLGNETELNALTEGTIVIRSHGVERRINDAIAEKGLHCVDATCPFVKKIHRIVEKESAAGRRIIIIGNRNHPEVEGICGWSLSAWNSYRQGWCRTKVCFVSAGRSRIRAIEHVCSFCGACEITWYSELSCLGIC